MKDLKGFIIAFILVASFSLLIITIGLNIQADNGGEQTLAAEQSISKIKSGLENNLTDITGEANTQGSNFWKDEPKPGTGVIFISTIFGVGRLLTGGILLLWDSTIGFIATLFGIPSWIMGVLGAIVLIILIFWAWKMLQTGE